MAGKDQHIIIALAQRGAFPAARYASDSKDPRGICRFFTSAMGTRFVAHIIRTSTISLLLLPRGVISPVCAKRSILALKFHRHFTNFIKEECAALRATYPRPSVRCMAPVNAPRMWPNSMLSIKIARDSGAIDGDKGFQAAWAGVM